MLDMEGKRPPGAYIVHTDATASGSTGMCLTSSVTMTPNSSMKLEFVHGQGASIIRTLLQASHGTQELRASIKL